MNANFIHQNIIYVSHHAEYLTLYNFGTDHYTQHSKRNTNLLNLLNSSVLDFRQS